MGEPVYVRHEIVHNKYVVDELKSKGAIFIKEVRDAPVDRLIIFSAHGVPKSVPLEAKNRKMIYVDATCPLVSKVHIEADRHFENGLQIIMIGHEGIQKLSAPWGNYLREAFYSSRAPKM